MSPRGAEDAAESPERPSSASKYRRSLLRQERSRQTRERLVRAAIKLWRTQGFEKTTIEEISAEAGVGWSTFYYHFPSKDSLLHDLGSLTAREVDDDVRADPKATFPEAVEAFVSSVAKRVAAVPRELVGAAVASNLAGLGNIGDPRYTGRHSFVATLEYLFAVAQESGELPADAAGGELAAAATAMLMEGMLRWALGTTSTDDLEAVLLIRARLFLHGALKSTQWLSPPSKGNRRRKA